MTTSSCAGRVSVFLEGEKHSAAKGGGEGEDEGARSAVPGGKGSGGRWLFVSHEAVRIPSERGNGEGSLTKLLGLFSSQREDADQELSGDVSGIRLVRFQFEPMVRRRYSHRNPLIHCSLGDACEGLMLK